jgi:hypothetical protein
MPPANELAFSTRHTTRSPRHHSHIPSSPRDSSPTCAWPLERRILRPDHAPRGSTGARRGGSDCRLWRGLCRARSRPRQPRLFLATQLFMEPLGHRNHQLHASITETRRVRRILKVECTALIDCPGFHHVARRRQPGARAEPVRQRRAGCGPQPALPEYRAPQQGGW